MKNLQDKKPKKFVKQGDVFRIGNHILACGDARDNSFVSKILGKKKVRVVLCDPPYGVDYTKSKENFSSVRKNKMIKNDGLVTDEVYKQFTEKWIMSIIPHLEKKNSFYIFNSDLMLFALREGMLEAGLKFSQLLVWIKNHAVIGRKDYLPMHELIAVGWYKSHTFRKSKDKSVIFCPKPNKSALHPTQKPISLLRRLILNGTEIGDIVYDCFGGSGSTMIACEQTKRRCVMIELDPEYCQTIIERFEKTFNINAKRL